MTRQAGKPLQNDPAPPRPGTASWERASAFTHAQRVLERSKVPVDTDADLMDYHQIKPQKNSALTSNREGGLLVITSSVLAT